MRFCVVSLFLIVGVSVHADDCETQINRELKMFNFGTYDKPNANVEKTISGNKVTFTRPSDRAKGTYKWQGSETVEIERGPDSTIIFISEPSMIFSLGNIKTVSLSSDCKVKRVELAMGSPNNRVVVTPELCQRYYYNGLSQPEGERRKNMAKDGFFEKCESMIGAVTDACTLLYSQEFSAAKATPNDPAAVR